MSGARVHMHIHVIRSDIELQNSIKSSVHLMTACTWSSLAPSGRLGTLHPATVQSVGRLETAPLV